MEGLLCKYPIQVLQVTDMKVLQMIVYIDYINVQKAARKFRIIWIAMSN